MNQSVGIVDLKAVDIKRAFHVRDNLEISVLVKNDVVFVSMGVDSRPIGHAGATSGEDFQSKKALFAQIQTGQFPPGSLRDIYIHNIDIHSLNCCRP
jgi:hypothetical protein